MKKSFTGSLKSSARMILDGKHTFFAGVTFLVTIFSLLLSLILTSVFGSGGMFNFVLELICSAIMNIIYYILLVGQQRLYLNLCRDEVYGFTDLFSSFTGRPDQIAIYALLQFVLQSLLYNGLVWVLLSIWFAYTATIWLVILGLTIGMILFVWVQLTLAFVQCLFVDKPWISAKDAFKESFCLLSGNKGKLFRIYLSFLGLDVLCLFSFGIGSLFVKPYRNVTLTLFYLEMSGQSEQQSAEETMDS